MAGIFCICPGISAYAMGALENNQTGTTIHKTNIREPGTADTPEE